MSTVTRQVTRTVEMRELACEQTGATIALVEEGGPGEFHRWGVVLRPSLIGERSDGSVFRQPVVRDEVVVALGVFVQLVGEERVAAMWPTWEFDFETMTAAPKAEL